MKRVSQSITKICLRRGFDGAEIALKRVEKIYYTKSGIIYLQAGWPPEISGMCSDDKESTNSDYKKNSTGLFVLSSFSLPLSLLSGVPFVPQVALSVPTISPLATPVSTAIAHAGEGNKNGWTAGIVGISTVAIY
jgi:hypothetical protein